MKVDFKLDNKSRSVLNDIIEGIDLLIESTCKEFPNASSSITSLSQEIFITLTGCEDDSVAEYKKDNTLLYNYSIFLSKACILAYLQKLDNDKNLNIIRDKMTEELELKIAKEEGALSEDASDEERESIRQRNKLPMDYKFGFSGLSTIVLACAEVITNARLNEESVNQRMQSNMLTNIREIEVSEYLIKGYMEQDIMLIAELGNKSKPDLVSSIIEFIKSNEIYNKYFEDVTDEVLGVYKYLLQDSFGLRPYVGVFSFSAPYLHVINDSFRLSTLKNSRTCFENINAHLASHYDIIENSKRQFDVKEVITSKSSKPIYFPKKLLEYAMGRQLTYELSENIYKPHSCNNSWDDYAEAYVKPQIRDLIIEAIYYSLERHFDVTKFGIEKGKNFSFASDEFKKIYSGDNIQKVHTYLSIDEMKVAVSSDVTKLQKSMCTGVVVTKYNNLGNKTNSVALRIVDTTNSLQTNLTSTLFGGLVINKKINFEDGDIISTGKMTTKSQPLPFDIYEFRHDFDSALSEAEPLFGYKAVELFKERGVPISWGRILLGEDTKGTPVFASLTSSDDFPMQSNFVHNMMAGSRSGKGVMTMNILASAVAQDKPIFYIDRKPDMAVLFSEISQGNMFVINGGQYEGKNDPQKLFSDNGTAIAGWSVAYDNMPSYLKEIFPTKSYAGDFGDMVYYRAIMFVLGIMVARVELSGNAEIYNKLGGTNGFVAIIDEFKNWQTVFEQRFFTCQGTFGNKYRLSKTDYGAYSKAEQDIKIKQVQLDTLDPEKKAGQIEKLRLEIQSKTEDMNNAIPPLKAYCTTVMNKYAESRAHIDEKTSAGFKEAEGNYSDIFVIGQHIEVDGFKSSDEGMYPQRDTGLFNVNESTKGKSLMRGILDGFFHDWFMGYNHDGDKQKKYMGADIAGSQAAKYLNTPNYWAYVNGATLTSLRSGSVSGARYFKPYLVLNKSFEDDPKHPKELVIGDEKIPHPDYTFVSQCRKRVNDAVPGAELWESVRLKHLQPGLREQVTDDNRFYDCLNEGIGFVGLANQTKLTNGTEEFNPSADLSKSLEIANYVASCMGDYADYREFLFDFSPMGLFSTRDIVRALSNPAEYKKDLKTRLPIFDKYNLLNTEDSSDALESASGFESGDGYEGNFVEMNEEEEEMSVESNADFSGSYSDDNDSNDTESGQNDSWNSYNYEDEDYDDDDEVTREELAEALVNELAPDFSEGMKARALEFVLEIFKERGIL